MFPSFFNDLAEKRKSTVFSYPKLHERIKGKKNESDRAFKLLQEISDQASVNALRNFERFLDVALLKLYDGINFVPAAGMDFKKLIKENCVVLVPNHQSHADYIALNYSIFRRYNEPVCIAGGINLNIFPIGGLFRRCGCFFIRRTFANDILYKLVLESYLFALLKEGHPIEFFFEGGRSRTGKLLPPRFGLYQMLLDAYECIPEQERKPLLFIPVSIIHEYLPEQKSLARELEGGKKVAENSTQLLKLFNLFSKHFGSIHIHLGNPILPDLHRENIKERTQQLAFECFRTVGANMPATPTSIISMVVLDSSSGALSLDEILVKANSLLAFCRKFKVPMTPSLDEDKMEASLKRCLDMLRGNGKLQEMSSGRGTPFYSVRPEHRRQLLYFKNTILHHFLVPWVIGRAWLALFRGEINQVSDLKKLFLEQRAQLKYEFYLPSVKEFFFKALNIISYCVGRRIDNLDDCLTLSHHELYLLAQKMAFFTRCCSSITEGHYISATTAKILSLEFKDGFKMDVYLKRTREVFETEQTLSRIIKFPESYNIPAMRNALMFLENQKLVEVKDGTYHVLDRGNLDLHIKSYEQNLTNQNFYNV